MVKFGLKSAAFGVCLLFATGAQARTYVDTRTTAGATVNFSLTTNGDLGVLTTDDIVSYNITITSGANVISFISGQNSAYTLVLGDALTATATNLFFDFSHGGNNFLVFNRGPAQGDHYCFETNGFCGSGPNAEAFRFGTGPFQIETRFGLQSIGSIAAVSGVPEPATWAMMLLGFGGIGYSMRRRRLAVGIAKFA